LGELGRMEYDGVEYFPVFQEYEREGRLPKRFTRETPKISVQA